jgi:hypothetical protein
MADPVDAAVEILLKHAMDNVREAMLPWEPEPVALKKLRDAFWEDFKENILEVGKPGSANYDDLVDVITRLFRYVGTAAALIAEAQVPGVRSPGSRKMVDFPKLAQACKLVEIGICPRPDPDEPRLRVCRRTTILDRDSGGETGLIKLVQERFSEYQDSNRHAVARRSPAP